MNKRFSQKEMKKRKSAAVTGGEEVFQTVPGGQQKDGGSTLEGRESLLRYLDEWQEAKDKVLGEGYSAGIGPASS